MNLIFRTIWLWLRSRRTPGFGFHDVGRLPMRVLPTDLDVLGHMNNGVYLSIADLGRLDLMRRSGVWPRLSARGYYPVVASETITFRKSLQPWQRFVLETRVAGYDDRAVYVEQRFVVRGEVYARMHIRGRFLKKSGGTVSLAELEDAVGAPLAGPVLPDWAARWAVDVALPSTRAEAPSTWE